MKKGFQIAIDGPVGAGKGTISKGLAEILDLVYVDTGAMYRAAALLVKENGVSIDDEERLAELVEKSSIKIRQPLAEERDGRLVTVLLDGMDVSKKIRKADISEIVPKVAALPEIRKVMVKKQKQMVKGLNVVVEGRDIALVVLPKADLKIFLDAEEEVRIDRRFRQMVESGESIKRDEVAQQLRSRDKIDKERSASPLREGRGVWHLDTSKQTINQVLEEIASRVKEMGFKTDNN